MRFVILILLAFIPYLAYGGTGYDTSEQDQLVASLQSDMDLISDKDMQQIRDVIKNEDPEFINKISSLNEGEQIVLMRNWMAKKAFNYYYDMYMAELKQKSQETGREIKTRHLENGLIEQHWWLERGDLDTDKCKQSGFNVCDYPDGFEEYEIMLQVYGNPQESENFTVTLIVEKDDIANNANKVFFIQLLAHQTKNSSNTEYSFSASVILDVSVFVEKYDEHHQWLNQEAADGRAGKYRELTKKERKKYKDGRPEWQSDWFPEVAITSVTYSYTQNENKQ